jgi:hypothetical protein
LAIEVVAVMVVVVVVVMVVVAVVAVENYGAPLAQIESALLQNA